VIDTEVDRRRVVGRKERTLADNFVDFKLVKERVSMESVLGRYNIRLRRVNRNSLRGKCPLPTHTSEQSKESFGVNTEKSIWSCQSNSCSAARQGKKGGNVLDFVAIMESCSIRDAALKLQEWFSITTTVETLPATPRAGRSREGEKEKLVAKKREESGEQSEVNKPLTFTLKDVDPTHAYIRQRGIRVETARHFGVGFFPGKGSMLGRVVIPIHNERGELIAYAGRSIDGSEPKYKLPSGFAKSAALFNFHRVEGDSVIIVEGFFDCLKVWQSGSRNVVALMGSSMSEKQEELLARFEKVILLLDGDEAGKGAASEIAGRLVHSHFVRIVELENGCQPDQLSSDNLRSLLQS
jgi:DNA primase